MKRLDEDLRLTHFYFTIAIGFLTLISLDLTLSFEKLRFIIYPLYLAGAYLSYSLRNRNTKWWNVTVELVAFGVFFYFMRQSYYDPENAIFYFTWFLPWFLVCLSFLGLVPKEIPIHQVVYLVMFIYSAGRAFRPIFSLLLIAFFFLYLPYLAVGTGIEKLQRQTVVSPFNLKRWRKITDFVFLNALILSTLTFSAFYLVFPEQEILFVAPVQKFAHVSPSQQLKGGVKSILDIHMGMSYSGFSPYFNINNARVSLSDEPVLSVRGYAKGYLRALTYSTYTGRGWVMDEREFLDVCSVRRNEGRDKLRYRAVVIYDPVRKVWSSSVMYLQFLFKFICDFPSYRKLVYRVTAEKNLSNVLFLFAIPSYVDPPSATTPILYVGDDFSVRTDYRIVSGNSYSAVSYAPVFSRKDLKAHSQFLKDALQEYREKGTISSFGGDPAASKFFVEHFYPKVLERYTQIPPVVSRKLAPLSSRLKGSSVLETVENVQEFLRTNYEYSTDVGQLEGDPVLNFLFRSKRGWCEHFASAFVLLLRECGVPARVVTGFAPPFQHRLNGESVVREKNAHAWAEVYFIGLGWVPFDPTPGSRMEELHSPRTSLYDFLASFLLLQPLESLKRGWKTFEYYLVKLNQWLNSVLKVNLTPTQTFLILTLIVIIAYTVLLFSLNPSLLKRRKLSPRERLREFLRRFAEGGETVREVVSDPSLAEEIEEILYNPRREASLSEVKKVMREVKKCASSRVSGKGES